MAAKYAFPAQFRVGCGGRSTDAGRMTDATKVRVEGPSDEGAGSVGWPGATAVLGQSRSAQVRDNGGFTHRVFGNGGGNPSRHVIVWSLTERPTRSRETFHDSSCNRPPVQSHYGLRSGTAPAREDGRGKGVGGSAEVALRFAFRFPVVTRDVERDTAQASSPASGDAFLLFVAECLSGLHVTGSARGRSRSSRSGLTGRPRTPGCNFLVTVRGQAPTT